MVPPVVALVSENTVYARSQSATDVGLHKLMWHTYMFQLRAHYTILVNGTEQPFEANFRRLMNKVEVFSRFRFGGARHAIHEFVTDRK